MTFYAKLQLEAVTKSAQPCSMNVEVCKSFQKGMAFDEATRVYGRVLFLLRCKEKSLLILLGVMLGILMAGSTALVFNFFGYNCLHQEALCTLSISPSPSHKPDLVQATKVNAKLLVSQNNLVNLALWTRAAENSVPILRFNEKDRLAWKNKIGTQPVVALHKGCGRMQNRLVTFADGTQACVRYRQNIDQIQGEIYAHRLAELLHFGGNLVPTNLALVDLNSEQWKRVRSQIIEAGWQDGNLVVMTQWLPNLSAVHIPWQLRQSNERLTAENVLNDDEQDLVNNSIIADLVQWSDMLLLDYMTANMDRFVNSLVNQQWNLEIMSDPAHNLQRASNRNLLVFLDNESALYHGFNLLPKYSYLHEDALRRLCVFRNSTISLLGRLAASTPTQLSAALRQSMLLTESEHLVNKLPSLRTSELSILRKRMNTVLEHVTYCQKISP